MQRSVSIIILFLLTFSAVAQKAKFSASVDAREIVEHSYLQVTFTLENANGNGFRAPKFEGFKVVSGPSTSRSTSIINGRKSSSIAFSYGLQPTSLGTKTIKPATVQVNGNTLQTKPIQIKVVKGSSAPVNNDEKFFVTTTITDSTVYVGQQMILSYKLHTIYDVRSINFLSEMDFDGFYKEVLNAKRTGYKREVINGKEYYTKDIKRVAIFPQQTGTYEIPPQSIEIGIATGKSGGFLFSSQLIKERILATGLKIQVNEAPSPIPDEFSGAVGRYSMQLSTPKKTITTDEAITIYMQIVGNGDNKTVNAPTWKLPDGLEMYDPNVIEDETFKNADQISHRKTFEYLIVAKEPGRYNISPSFTYFNTDSSKYVSLSDNIRGIKVLKGSNSTVVTPEAKVELAEIKPADKLKLKSKSLYHSPIHLGLMSLIFLSSIGIFLYGEQLKKSGKRDPDEIRRNKAYEIATKRLEGAKVHLDANRSKEFHEEVIVALKKYLAEKRDIPALHMKKTELVSSLREHDLDEVAIEKFSDLMGKAELAMYAPGLSSTNKETYQNALNWIKHLEEA